MKSQERFQFTIYSLRNSWLFFLGLLFYCFCFFRFLPSWKKQTFSFSLLDFFFFCLLTLICLMPGILLIYAKRGDLLSRYVFLSFFKNFLLCNLVFWLFICVFDSNLLNLPKESLRWGDLIFICMAQVPITFVNFLPLSVLISLFLSFRHFSLSSEIVAMWQCRRGIFYHSRLIWLSLFYFSFLSFFLNYEISPSYQQKSKQIIADLRGKSLDSQLEWVLSYYPEGKRLWLIGAIPSLERGIFNKVWITSLDSSDKIQSRLQVEEARFLGEKKGWEFQKAQITQIQGESATFLKSIPRFKKENWQESPKDLIEHFLPKEMLTIPQLFSYFQSTHSASYVAEFARRGFLSFSPLVVAFFTLPFSVSGGRYQKVKLFPILLLYFSLSLFSKLLLLFSQIGFISGFTAFFIPLLLFGAVGYFLSVGRLAEFKNVSLN